MTWKASKANPVTVHYCKSALSTGMTVIVTQDGSRVNTRGVKFRKTNGKMVHGNSRGKAKAQGARCVLKITEGTISEVN